MSVTVYTSPFIRGFMRDHAKIEIAKGHPLNVLKTTLSEEDHQKVVDAVEWERGFMRDMEDQHRQCSAYKLRGTLSYEYGKMVLTEWAKCLDGTNQREFERQECYKS